MAGIYTAQEARTLQRARHLFERTLTDPQAPLFDRVDATRDYLRARFAGLDHEQVHALYLDFRHALIAAEVVGIGTLNQVTVHPREIARAALRLNAGAVILAHNHPSGEAKPSRADELVTLSVRAALDLIGVRLLDHVVVARTTIASAAERGVL